MIVAKPEQRERVRCTPDQATDMQPALRKESKKIILGNRYYSDGTREYFVIPSWCTV